MSAVEQERGVDQQWIMVGWGVKNSDLGGIWWGWVRLWCSLGGGEWWGVNDIE